MARTHTVAAAAELSASPRIRPTPVAALGLPDMPTGLHFVRNHFDVPAPPAGTWSLELDGTVERPATFSLDDLRSFPARTQTVTLECAGHRRSEFAPSATGVQWGVGALSEARWTGVALEDLLLSARPWAAACEVVFEGADRGKHRTTHVDVPFARSIPLARALTGDVLLAWSMNGRPLPSEHGAPLRVVVPGVYAVASVKWLRRIHVVDKPFDGAFQVEDYRMLGGAEDGESLQELNVNALVVTPEDESVVQGSAISVAGVAWGGRGGLERVEFRLAGESWRPAVVADPHPPYGLAHWRGALVGVPAGRRTIEVRACDKAGRVQPAEPRWNALGYANNSRHRVQITVVE
jgi:DMSO/TMAO reductase YedYZ molybdopterin-dependent catalytic subunit